jgi:hypothetical protein
MMMIGKQKQLLASHYCSQSIKKIFRREVGWATGAFTKTSEDICQGIKRID